MSQTAEEYLELLFSDEPLFENYIEAVARNPKMLEYKLLFQYGKKAGESLYTHVLNGVCVLETLRPFLQLSDEEAQVLYTAFTVHDINKMQDNQDAFTRLATVENIAPEIERLGLDRFFPAWRDYVNDIVTLVRGHSGHTGVAGEALIARRRARYVLGAERVNALIRLMRAADVLDLSKTLEEAKHKQTFLSHLNFYLAASGIQEQYAFFTHQLVEQRGILSNVIHNTVIEYVENTYGGVPLLFYPEGVAYLVPKGEVPTPNVEDVRQIGRQVAGKLNRIVRQDFAEFINSRIHGIKVDLKCLELGVSFDDILREIANLVDSKVTRMKSDELEVKVRERAERDFDKNKAETPQVAEEVIAMIETDAPLVSRDGEKLRLAELVRSYYIFLQDHFKQVIDDPWERIYPLINLPKERWPVYAYFDARYDRAYALSNVLSLSWNEVYDRILADGTALLGDNKAGNEKAELFADYLARYLVFGVEGRPLVEFGDELVHYVGSQHKQCVYCGGPFETDKWMTGDVRPDITVQTFSNRLRGGPGEPKKNICAVCQAQFLLERLNYPEVRGESLLYLHLYPYSFLTAPFIEGAAVSFRRLRERDTAIRALNVDSVSAINDYLMSEMQPPRFRSRTKAGKPQPYGLYVPRFAETTGNLFILPINPGGNNDTERFLFALWNALVMQRYFGVKVLLSTSPVAPLGKEDFADLFIDNVPLACEGLLPRSDYAEFQNGSQEKGTLDALWGDVKHLFALRRMVFSGGDDKMPALVRALNGSPLLIFYETEKLLERRLQKEGSGTTWLHVRLREACEHVEALALSKGGSWMAELSKELRNLAGFARQNWIAGRSWKKSSLLFPLKEVFDKFRLAGHTHDLEVLRAATVQDIFDHLVRVAERGYTPGKTKREAVKVYVDGWYNDILEGIYGGSLRKLLSDEKLLRSAYLTYFSEANGKAEEPSGEDSPE